MGAAYLAAERLEGNAAREIERDAIVVFSEMHLPDAFRLPALT
jgi:hypothetical protein